MKNGELKKLFNIFVKSKEWERIKGIILDKMDSTFCWLVDTEGHYCFKKENDKDFCRMIKSSTDGTKRCEKFLMFTLSQARKNKMPTCAMCEAGFLGFACPILIGQEVIGTIGGCQIANSDLTYSSYGDIARKFNLDPDKFMAVVHKENHLMPTEVLEIEVELITLLAQSALELVFKREQLVEREEEIKGISESYQLFGGSRESILNLGKENLYSLIVNMVARAMGAEICSLMLLDEETQELTMKAAVGLDIPIVSKTKVKVGEGVVGYVIHTAKPLLVEDIEQDTRFTRTFRSNRYYTKSLLTAPLKINDKVIGVISVNNKATHGPFNQRDLELFTQICKHIGLAIENLKPYPTEEEKEKEVRASEVGRLRQEAEQLELLCNVKREEIKELEQQVAQMGKPYPDQLLKEYEEQKAVVEGLNKEIEEEAIKIKNFESEIERLNIEISQRPRLEEIKEIKAELEAETVKVTGYEEEIERLNAQIVELTTKPDEIEIEELRAQTIIAQEAKIYAEELKIKLEEESAKTQLQTQELERLTADLESMKEIVAPAQDKLEAERLKVTALTEQIEEFTTQVGEIELLKSQIKELRENVGVKGAKGVKEEIELEPTDVKAYADTLKTKLDAEEAKTKALIREIDEIKSQLRDTRLKSQLEELERLKKERATLQQLQAQTALIKDLRVEAEKAKERVRTENLELDELKAQQAKLGLLYQVKQEIKDALRQQAEAKNAQDEKAQDEAEERLKELRAQNEELEKLRAQSRELNFLFRMSQELAQMLERERILGLVLDEAHTYLDYYVGAYLMVKDEKLTGIMRKNCRLDEQMIEDLKGRMLAQWLEWNPRRKKETKRQISFQITGEEVKPIPREEERGDGFISAPIRETDKTIGILSAYSFRKDGWTPLQKRLLTIIADQVSVALERGRLFEEMKESAERDELTKVYNFRYFEKFFDKEYELAVRYNQPLSLIMLDFDHLKHFNDTYGHEAGNRLIKAVAQSIQRNVRKTDWVTRFGGDEFAIIMPQTNQEGALLVGEKVRQAIAEREMVFGGHTYRLTASLGVSTCYKEDTSFNAKMLVSRADEALYRAKQEGRNRVCLYRPGIKQEPIKVKYQWKDVFLALMRPLS
ncbi:MAG: diguanylate cyclase [bacterium]|nr:diguanylate cyclase [bacterium]